MKKIKAKHNNKDRIICASETGKHKFYFQPADTKERYWLFNTKSFSRSVLAFFRKHGRNFKDIGFSVTVKELYDVGNCRNPTINKILDRIPAQIEYVLSEREEFIQIPRVTEEVHYHSCDFDRAA